MISHEEELLPPWRTQQITRPLVTNWLSIRQDVVQIQTGTAITYTFVEHAGSVIVVPITSQGDVFLLYQYRYPINTWCWELPAGGLDGEEPVVAARRELQEEIGGSCDELHYIASFYTSNGTSNEQATVFLAPNVKIGEKSPECTEVLRVFTIPVVKALRMVRSGQIKDGPSALALLLSEPYLQSISGLC